MKFAESLAGRQHMPQRDFEHTARQNATQDKVRHRRVPKGIMKILFFFMDHSHDYQQDRHCHEESTILLSPPRHVRLLQPWV